MQEITVARLLFTRVQTKEFISKMEGNTGNFTDIRRSEIHGGHCVHTIVYTDRASFPWENPRIPPAGGGGGVG